MRTLRSSGPVRPAFRHRPRLQTGLTLIELMVSIVIGMLLIAAMATLIASQSSSRSEIDKSGKLIENGRYGVQTIATDVQLAGYWGELVNQPTATVLSDPCSVTVAALTVAMGLHVQGYNSPATLPVNLQACVKNHKPGTDVLVVRHADPDTTSIETAGEVDLAKITPGQMYVQIGLDATGVNLATAVAAGSSDAATNATAFTLKKKDKIKLASLRKYVVDIYFISKCSVPASSGTCATNADGGTPIPTLKRVELGSSTSATACAPAAAPCAAFTTFTLAEGIENLQFDYGIDTDGDGSANGADVNGEACPPIFPATSACPLPAPTYPFAAADWSNVVSVKTHILARSLEKSGSFLDDKTYALGSAGSVSVATGEAAFKRHVFVQSTRIINPSGRRAL